MPHRTASSYFTGRNFMTPDVIECGFRKGYAYELSYGTFLSQPLYGVTLADRQSGASLHDQSRCFDNSQAALSYIDNLTP